MQLTKRPLLLFQKRGVGYFSDASPRTLEPTMADLGSSSHCGRDYVARRVFPFSLMLSRPMSEDMLNGALQRSLRGGICFAALRIVCTDRRGNVIEALHRIAAGSFVNTGRACDCMSKCCAGRRGHSTEGTAG